MANEYLTMLDILKMNEADPLIGLVEEAMPLVPELGVIPASTKIGTTFKTLHRTARPTGGFRNPGEGVEVKKSTYENRIHEMKYLDHQMEIDVAHAQGAEQGEAFVLATEAEGHVQSAMNEIATQIWYGTGTGGDSKGFQGAVQIVDSALVADAGGTTASTGSSVYLLQLGKKQVELKFGVNKVLSLAEWRKQTVTRNSKEMTAWKNSLEGWCGVGFENKYAVARIKKLTEDSGKGLTDTLLYKLLRLMKEKSQNITPQNSILVMSPRSQEQLRLSRTATNPTGAPAPLPTDWNGIPILVSNAILNTEALTL